MTIKDLKEALSNLPDDGEVYVQRIEDKYFEGEHPWSVKRMKGQQYWNGVKFNVESDTYKEEYPFGDWSKYSLKELEDLEEQYIDTHCCINYDGKNLYICRRHGRL